MKREARLQAAKYWIPKYEGIDIIKGYGRFYYIVGYTSGGAPYGITWEEAIKDGLVEDNQSICDLNENPIW